MSGDDKRILRDEAPAAAFWEFVQSAMGRHGVDAAPETEHYLVTLLDAFVRATPDRLSRPLGPELASVDQLDPIRRSMRLKDLGDTTLFLAGVFLDYIEAKPATTEYYYTIGRTAYGRLAGMARNGTGGYAAQARTFAELSERFVSFATVLSTVADSELFGGSERLVSIYNRWLATGSPRDAARLIAKGVIPTPGDGSTH